MKIIATTLGSLALAAAAAAPALTAASAQDSLGSTLSKMTTEAIGGMSSGTRPTTGLQVEKAPTGSLMTSKLIGASVVNGNDETIGKVEDLVIVQGKAISGVIISVGGFLGIGDSYVLINPASFAVSEKDGAVTVHLDASKKQLQDAPKFTYRKS